MAASHLTSQVTPAPFLPVVTSHNQEKGGKKKFSLGDSALLMALASPNQKKGGSEILPRWSPLPFSWPQFTVVGIKRDPNLLDQFGLYGACLGHFNPSKSLTEPVFLDSCPFILTAPSRNGENLEKVTLQGVQLEHLGCAT